MRVEMAKTADAEALTALINAAFAVEKFFIDGNRVNLDMVRALLEKGRFLVARNEAGVAGCVYLERRGERGYLGLLSVDPARQKTGLGRLLMEAAEDYGRECWWKAVDLRVVNLREELPAFYRRLGYQDCGEEEFPPGEPARLPCHFLKMTKAL